MGWGPLGFCHALFLDLVTVSQMLSFGDNSSKGKRNDFMFLSVCFITFTKIKKKNIAIVDRKIISTRCFVSKRIWGKRKGCRLCGHDKPHASGLRAKVEGIHRRENGSEGKGELEPESFLINTEFFL